MIVAAQFNGAHIARVDSDAVSLLPVLVLGAFQPDEHITIRAGRWRRYCIDVDRAPTKLLASGRGTP